MRSKEFSVQQKLRLKPDLSTFGKIIGGGVPIGVTAISKNFETKLKKSNIFLGGTYSANPFGSYIGLETLKFILKNKNKFYKKINDITDLFYNNLNYFLKQNNFKIRVYRYESMARLIFSNIHIKNRQERDLSEKKIKIKISKFQNFLKSKNILHPSTGAYFFSYAHEKNDIKRLLVVFKEGIKKFF